MTIRQQTTFPRLLSPGKIGPITLDNRVVLPAMDMNLCEDGEIHQGDIDHFASRAEGGTGMIITGCCAVAYPAGCTSRKEPGLSEDRFIPGLKALADAVHAAGSKLCVQMTHHGKVARIDTSTAARSWCRPSRSPRRHERDDRLHSRGAREDGRHSGG